LTTCFWKGKIFTKRGTECQLLATFWLKEKKKDCYKKFLQGYSVKKEGVLWATFFFFFFFFLESSESLFKNLNACHHHVTLINANSDFQMQTHSLTKWPMEAHASFNSVIWART
jgi:hypothetical protein